MRKPVIDPERKKKYTAFAQKNSHAAGLNLFCLRPEGPVTRVHSFTFDCANVNGL